MNKYILLLTMTIGLGLSAQGQELPTIGEIFDYSIDDEFHYFHSYENSLWVVYGWYGYSIDKILDVQFTPDSSDVIYTIFREGYTIHYYDPFLSIPDSLIFYSDTLIETYSNLDSSLYNYSSGFTSDTIHYMSDSLCGIEVFGHQGSGDLGGTFQNEWGIGLGKTSYFSGFEQTDIQDILTYFYKNGIECGTPVSIEVGIDENDNSEKIDLFPTVFEDHIWVRSNTAQHLHLTLYSISGKEVFNSQLNSAISQVDLSSLDSGSYLYTLRNKSSILTQSGMIIKE